jgi:3-hydroxyacyl-CoA dehydrogenase/enoyl-CoA hydratase/3-hydroxybutyryl-CoA epimerase
MSNINNTFQHLTHSSDENDIAWLILDVKGESANVIGPELIEEMNSAINEIKSSNPKGMIISSGKNSGFIAGADVKKFEGMSSSESDFELALSFIHLGQSLCQKIEDLSFPTLAMVKGFCMGGGLEIALSCDYIVADDAPSTKLSLPEIQLGIHPGFGGTVRSIRRMGVLQAMPIMLTGRNLLPRQAKKMGLIDYCVPLRQLKPTAIQTILRKPAKHQAPKSAKLLEASPMRKIIAMQMRKQVASKAKQEHYPAPYALINIWEMHGALGNEMYEAEAHSVATLVSTDTAQNLVRVFFLQNRLKALGDKKLFTPKHVHVIGGGVMGGDIAAWCAMQGLRVTIQDMNTEALGRVVGRANSGFKRRFRKDKVRIMQAQDNLIPDLHGHGIAKADVIIEAIFENLEAKQEIFKNVEKKAKKTAIIATNTSSIPLHEIAEVMKKPERLVGLHFFNPVFKMPLLEIVLTPDQTDPKVVALAQSFGAHINKLPLPVKSSPGFLINRILMPYILEGVTLYQEGVPATVVDKAAVDYGMPMGPLELADTVGLDICLHVGKILADTVGVTLPDTLDKEVESGRLGKKSGQGFYTWKKDKKVKPDNKQWNGDTYEVQQRMIEKLLSEAKSCLDENIVDDSDLLDAGVIFGTGFAPFRGGPMNALLEAKEAL